MTSFTLTITRHVTGCLGELDGSVEVQVAASRALDSSAMFTLHSDGWFSTSDIKGEFAADGSSTGLNTASEDATTTVISDVVSAAASIAPLLAAAGAGGNKADVCRPDVSDAVLALNPPKGSKIESLRDKVDRETAELAAATDRVTVRTAEITALGRLTDLPTRKALLAAVEDVLDRKKQLADDQEELDADVKLTSDVTTVTWPSTGTDLAGGPFPMDIATLTKKWIKSDPNGNSDTGKAIQDARDAVHQFDVYVQLDRTGTVGVDTTHLSAVPAIDVSKGIPVRFAMPGRLTVCAGSVPTPAEGTVLSKPCDTDGVKRVGKYDGPVLQLGLAYVVPAKGGTFRSETSAIALDVNGVPTSVEVAEKVAPATAVSGILKSTATQAAGVPAAIDAAALARIKAQSDQLNAEAAVQTAIANGQDASVIAPIQAETLLAQARTAQLNADAALATAQKAQAAASP